MRPTITKSWSLSVKFFIICLLLLSQSSWAHRDAVRIETSTHVYSLESLGPNAGVTVVEKDTAQVTLLDLHGKVPVRMTLENQSLFIWCTPSSIYTYDVATKTVHPNPYLFEPLIHDLVILNGIAFAVRDHTLLVVGIKENTEWISITLPTEKPKISIKDDVIILNGKVLNVEHLLKNFSIAEIKEDLIPEAITATQPTSSTSSTSSSSVPPAAPSSTVAEPKSTTEKKTQKLDKKAQKIAKMLKAAQGDKALGKADSDARVKKLEKRLKKTQQKAKKVQKNN